MKILNDFFADMLCGMQHVEKKFVATLPKIPKTASNEELARALANHKADELLTTLADRIELMAAQAA